MVEVWTKWNGDVYTEGTERTEDTEKRESRAVTWQHNVCLQLRAFGGSLQPWIHN